MVPNERVTGSQHCLAACLTCIHAAGKLLAHSYQKAEGLHNLLAVKLRELEAIKEEQVGVCTFSFGTWFCYLSGMYNLGGRV
jgi:hypothetical protein